MLSLFGVFYKVIGYRENINNLLVITGDRKGIAGHFLRLRWYVKVLHIGLIILERRMSQQYGFIFICLLLLLPTTNVMADKVYKWTDDNGVVHYSQVPPSVNSAKKADVMQQAGGAVKPRRRGHDFYCGDSRLPELHDNPARAISTLKSGILRWEDMIDRARERNIKNANNFTGERSYRYGVQSRHEQLRRLDSEIAEYQCQISWAEGKLKGYVEKEKAIVGDFQSLTAALERIQAAKERECGTKPTGWVANDESYRLYKDCSRNFQREEKRIERELRAAKKNVKMIEGR